MIFCNTVNYMLVCHVSQRILGNPLLLRTCISPVVSAFRKEVIKSDSLIQLFCSSCKHIKITTTQNQGQAAHLKQNGNQGEGREFVQVIHFLRSQGQYLMGILICINFKLNKTICCVGPGNAQPSLHNCGGKKYASN